MIIFLCYNSLKTVCINKNFTQAFWRDFLCVQKTCQNEAAWIEIVNKNSDKITSKTKKLCIESLVLWQLNSLTGVWRLNEVCKCFESWIPCSAVYQSPISNLDSFNGVAQRFWFDQLEWCVEIILNNDFWFWTAWTVSGDNWNLEYDNLRAKC